MNLYLICMDEAMHKDSGDYWYALSDGERVYNLFSKKDALMSYMDLLGLKPELPISDNGEWKIINLIDSYHVSDVIDLSKDCYLLDSIVMEGDLVMQIAA